MVFAVSRSEARTRAFAARFGLPVTTDIDAVVVEPAIYAVLLFTAPGARTSRFGSIRTYTDHVFKEDSWAVTQLVVRPTLEVWKPETPNGTAVIVLPGSAYQRVVVDKEGIEIGERLAGDGITVFVLTYRLPGGGHAQALGVALQDAQRAVCLLRKNAAAWGLKSDRIGVLGFSAGDHVAASLGTRFDRAVYKSVDDADALSARPDLLALIYPVISMKADVTHAESPRS